MDGLIKFPAVRPDAHEMMAPAWAAMARQEADEALRQWERVRQSFPERPEGHIWPVQVLWQSGRVDEAEARAAEAFARFPEHPDLLVQYAWIAMSRQRWVEALRWWAAARLRAPERLDCYVWAARALWQSGRLDDAEAMAADALERFPEEILALVESAWVATTRRGWDEALRRWMLVHRSHPERADAAFGATQALRMVGRLDEAEAMAADALSRSPNDPDLLIEYVRIAIARDDWSAAKSRLATARAGSSDKSRFDSLESEIRAGAEGSRKAAPVAVLAAVPSAGGMPVSELMLAFESLGDRCDFGSVQRHFGVEPRGLLRFAYSPFDALIAALDDRFQDIGTVEDVSFELYGDENILYAKKYGLIFHTYVYESELTTPEKREAFCRRQRQWRRALKKKLVVDLEEGRKIFIYASEERTADDDVARLFAAVRAYGQNSLLYVRPARDDRPEGTVEVIEDGLYAGYFSGLTDFVGGGQPRFELWRRLCERTYRLARCHVTSPSVSSAA